MPIDRRSTQHIVVALVSVLSPPACTFVFVLVCVCACVHVTPMSTCLVHFFCTYLAVSACLCVHH